MSEPSHSADEAAATPAGLTINLDSIVKLIQRWQKMGERPAPEAEAGSALAADSARSPVYDVGHAAWSGVMVAIDHLHAVQALLVEAQMVHSYSPFSLIRGAIDNAALAVWLLAPANQDERLFRRLHLAYEDVRQSEDARSALGARAPQPPRSGADRLAEISNLAKSLGVNPTGAVGARWAGYENIVKAAAAEVHLEPGLVTFIWRACSGFGHGRQWAGLALLQREEFARSAGVRDVRLTSSPEQILLTAGIAVVLNQRALSLYDQRRRADDGAS